MALDQPFDGDLDGHIDKPQLVHELGGVAPGPAVEGDVVPLKDDNARGWRDGDVVFDGILDRMVETGSPDGRGFDFDRLAEELDEFQELLSVEGESGSAAENGFLGVVEGGQLLPLQV